MNSHQRQEQKGGSIYGKRINNKLACTVKQLKRLSPQVIQEPGRQITFQTDSFKQILTKRSGCQVNKENLSIYNRPLRKIKEETGNKQLNAQKKKVKSNMKKGSKKTSAVSLTKLYERNKSGNERKKQTKSVSPSRDIKEYRSGPVQKKNYLSNNTCSKGKENNIGCKSQKSLTDRIKTNTKNLFIAQKKQEKKPVKGQKKQLNKSKKQNSSAKLGLTKKTILLEKVESIAKEFDSMLKTKRGKKKKEKKSSNSKEKKKGSSKSKEKKIIISQNNSKNFISKNKMNSDYSHESPDSTQKAILSTRYYQNSQKKRLSFEPARKKGKTKEKAKTETLSPDKNLDDKNQAAKVIQKVFRGYLTRKYIKQFKQILLSVITIQRFWRGYKARKEIRALKQETMKKNKISFRLERVMSLDEQKKLYTPRENQLASLLAEILKEESVNEKIKNRISGFLKKQQRAQSSINSSAQSHLQQEMRSQRRYFEQFDRRKPKFGSPVVGYSPRLDKSQLNKSPEIMIENLLTIKQFQKQKLILNAKLQIEGIESLAIKNIFSPRTTDAKKTQVHKKLEQDLQKFDDSITQVIKNCQQNEEIVNSVRPFEDNVQDETNVISQFDKNIDRSPVMKKETANQQQQKLNNSSERKLQDLSMQLLQYYEQKNHSRIQRQYQKLDPSYQFIEQYLLSLFQYLRQLGYEYRQTFINSMRTSRNIDISSLLKNLNVVTEESDEDLSFKLPFYKYIEQQQAQVLERSVVQQFNCSNKKLQRHQLGLKINIQDVYLKMILDAVNQALNIQRPNQYIFTETSLFGRSNQMRIQQLQAIDGLDNNDNETEFSFYFANSMNHIYKWGHSMCGRTTDDGNEYDSIMQLNQISLKEYLKQEAIKTENYYDELMQVIIHLSDCVFNELILQEGVRLYL